MLFIIRLKGQYSCFSSIIIIIWEFFKRTFTAGLSLDSFDLGGVSFKAYQPLLVI